MFICSRLFCVFVAIVAIFRDGDVGRAIENSIGAAVRNRFFGEQTYDSTPHRTGDTRIFSVYSAYESDAHGAFDVTAGVAVSEGADSVAIEAGDYLVFTGRGEMPQMVIATWQRIWQYFEAHPEIVRRYRSDFEAYEGPDAVAIYIGVS